MIKFSKTITGALAVVAVLAGSPAFAIGESFPATPGQPFSVQKAWVIDRKQDVTITFNFGPDGTGAFTARFSNGKKLDGDHMYAKVMLVDATGNVIGIGQHRVGINASFGGKTKVRSETRAFNLGPEAASRVATVVYDVGHFQGRDDAAFWKKVTEIGGSLIGSMDNGFLTVPSSMGIKAPKPAVQF